MKRNGWHMVREADRLTLARHWPPRFDVSARARFPLMRRGRLAQQVRQDMWRALQGLRGFSPVIVIESGPNDLCLIAGGRCAQPVARRKVEARIAGLLACPHHRARWSAWAQEPAL